jgi:hypothetical protein
MTNWDKAYEVDNAVLIDGVAGVGNDSGNLVFKDSFNPTPLTLSSLLRSANFDAILLDNEFEILSDNEFNVLEGI